tara:strand:- start:211 stop:336 length:126 start_codon:yes stop_codon:yes gene_type:complete
MGVGFRVVLLSLTIEGQFCWAIKIKKNEYKAESKCGVGSFV